MVQREVVPAPDHAHRRLRRGLRAPPLPEPLACRWCERMGMGQLGMPGERGKRRHLPSP
uniref:Uncharacterized protein n=1 Tax=Arundo donax TaxID=35708 RepID=A0A0A9GWJ8_ARUDO